MRRKLKGYGCHPVEITYYVPSRIDPTDLASQLPGHDHRVRFVEITHKSRLRIQVMGRIIGLVQTGA